MVISPECKYILIGWRDKNLPKIWRFALKSNGQERIDTKTNLIAPVAHNAYYMPSLEALVRYMHAAVGFPVKAVWLRAIKKGNFATRPGLTYSNASKYCPQSVETLKGGMVQSSQRARPTKKDKHNNQKIKKVSEEEELLPPIQTKELHIWDHLISKL